MTLEVIWLAIFFEVLIAVLARLQSIDILRVRIGCIERTSERRGRTRRNYCVPEHVISYGDIG